MKRNPLFRFVDLLLALLLLLFSVPGFASDHANPLVLNPLRPPKVREPRITDLHVFLDKDQNPKRPAAGALVFDLCVFPAMAPVEKVADSDMSAGTVSSLASDGTRPRYKLPASIGKLGLAPFTYRVCFDLYARLGFENPADLARYGGTVLQPIRAMNVGPIIPGRMDQPARKLYRVTTGEGPVGLLFMGLIFALGRRSASHHSEPEPFPPGNQGVNDRDLPIATDSYDDVKKAVFANPYYDDAWGGPERRLLPVYKQTVSSLLLGFFPLGKRLFLRAAKRTVSSRSDLRWGADGKGFRRLLHPMGICLTGTWRITDAPKDTAYTGYFAKGAEGRIIGRYSTGGSKPWGGHYRSLALVGKIYPPAGAGPQPPAAPAHFFTQEDLGATFTNNIREAILTNSPPVSPWNRGKDVFFLIINGLTLLVADTKNSERQLYEIAELGKPKHTPTSCPRFMKLTVSKETPVVGGDGTDFRDEILGILYDRGNPVPTGRKLIFDIAVSDAGTKWGFGIEFLTGQDWTTIGQIIFDAAAASYNGDFVIHFHHPPWRNDRNVPGSVVRRELKS